GARGPYSYDDQGATTIGVLYLQKKIPPKSMRCLDFRHLKSRISWQKESLARDFRKELAQHTKFSRDSLRPSRLPSTVTAILSGWNSCPAISATSSALTASI